MYRSRVSLIYKECLWRPCTKKFNGIKFESFNPPDCLLILRNQNLEMVRIKITSQSNVAQVSLGESHKCPDYTIDIYLFI